MSAVAASHAKRTPQRTRATRSVTSAPEAWLPAAWAAYEVRIDPEPFRMSAQQVAAWRGVWRMLFDKAAAAYCAEKASR